MTYEESPCKLCMVRAACTDPCAPAMNYLRKKIMDFKPKGSPESPPFYLKRMIIHMIKHPTTEVSLSLAYKNRRSVRCIMIVEDLSIVSITDYRNTHDKPMQKLFS